MPKSDTMKKSLIAVACSIAIAAAADDVAKRIDVPAGDLVEALQALEKQSDAELVYQAAQLSGFRTRGVSGTLSIQEAVKRLLEGTKLRMKMDEGTGAMLIALPSLPSTSPLSSPEETSSGLAQSAERIRLARAEQSSLTAGEGQGQVAEQTAAIEWTEDQPRPQEKIELEELVVTGSRIHGIRDRAEPLVVLDRAYIERSGADSTAQLLKALPQNFGGTTAATPVLTGGNLGFTNQVDIRGLGSEATLVLVNGRRISSAGGDSGRAVDIDMIPISAIERVDVLADGASALYGSDAIGGVVNAILRRDFEGIETSARYGFNSGNSDTFLASMTGGFTWTTGRMLGSVQLDGRDAIRSRDFGITGIDHRAVGGGDFRIPGFGTPGTVYPSGFFDSLPFDTVTQDGGPVFVAALPAGSGRQLDLADLRLNDMNIFDRVPPEVTPRQRNASIFLTIEQDVGPVVVFADGVFARRRGQITSLTNPGFLFVPATNAYTPFAEDVLVAYEFPDFPTVFHIDNEGWFTNAGVKGTVAGGWTWEAVGSVSEDESRTDLGGVDQLALAERLASSDPTLAFNPFGDGSGQAAGVVEALRSTRIFSGKTALQSLAVQSQGRLLDLPGGALRLAIGGEYRREGLETSVGFAGEPPTESIPKVTRDIWAAYGELHAPLIAGKDRSPTQQLLTLSAAARFEHYSDFGSTANPKVGAIWRPFPALALKANWGTSFRAPSLRELSSVPFAEDNVPIFDPNAPGGGANVFIHMVSISNPNLKEEEAETVTLTGEFAPQWPANTLLSLGYFRTTYDNRIRGDLDGLGASELLQFESFLPPGIVIRASDGTLQQINTTNINSASTTLDGFDFSVSSSGSLGAFGNLEGQASVTIIDTYRDQLIESAPQLSLAGKVGSPPDWRGRASLTWSRAGLAATAAVNHLDGLFNEDSDPRIVRRKVDSQTTVDVQLSYRPQASASPWLRGTVFRFGIDNAFDSEPPFVDGLTRFGIDAQNSVLGGRTIYLGLTNSLGVAE